MDIFSDPEKFGMTELGRSWVDGKALALMRHATGDLIMVYGRGNSSLIMERVSNYEDVLELLGLDRSLWPVLITAASSDLWCQGVSTALRRTR